MQLGNNIQSWLLGYQWINSKSLQWELNHFLWHLLQMIQSSHPSTYFKASTWTKKTVKVCQENKKHFSCWVFKWNEMSSLFYTRSFADILWLLLCKIFISVRKKNEWFGSRYVRLTLSDTVNHFSTASPELWWDARPHIMNVPHCFLAYLAVCWCFWAK